MNYYSIAAAIIITMLFTLIFSLISKRSVRRLWLFFVIIFLSTWAGQIWIPSFGPSSWGIAWIPLFAVALVFSVIVLLLFPTITNENKKTGEGGLSTGTFFWIVFACLIIVIVAGFLRSVH